MRVVAAEISLFDGIDAARELRPQMFVVDKAFGVHAVADCIASLREHVPGIFPVVWGAGLTENEALRLLQLGAKGVVHKTAPLDVLLRCFRTVASGGVWMEEDLMPDHDRSPRTGRSPLTAREAQVMELVERGLKNKDIGHTLGIQTGTVKIHLKHIFEKTGIRGRYGLALSGLRDKGLLTTMGAEAAVE
jgi:DNA-binding NarL/FixJ family response regulator